MVEFKIHVQAFYIHNILHASQLWGRYRAVKILHENATSLPSSQTTYRL